MRRPLELEPVMRPVPRWYGGMTLLADGLALTVGLLGLATEREPVLIFAAAGYVFGGPLVHVGHGNWGRAGLSLALRVLLPWLSVALAASAEDCPEDADFCGLGAVAIGVPIGMLTAIVLDAAVIARDTVYEPVRVQPIATLRRDGLWVGVQGAL